MNKQQSKFNRQKALRHSNQESKRITRESVEVAFVDLLSKKEINKISISEITKRAGVSRSAFYRNYTSKEEILASISHHLLDYVNKYFQEIVTHKHNSFFYQEIFSKVRMEKRTFAIFIKTGILEKNSTKIMSFIDENLPYVSSKTRYLLYGWAGMMLHILVKWYEEGMKESDETMGNLCYELFEKLCQEIKKFDPEFLVEF